MSGSLPSGTRSPKNFEKFGEAGAAVAVTIDGKPVVDLWHGVVDKETRKLWQRASAEEQRRLVPLRGL